MPDQLDPSFLKSITNALVDTLTSDEFLSRMREVRNAAEGERLRTAAAFLSIDALRTAGLKTPDGFRVSSRFFEDNFQSVAGSASDVGAGPHDNENVRKATPLSVCAGGGAGTVCACGGQCVSAE